MKILHIITNEYNSASELSNALSRMPEDMGPFVIAKDRKDAEKKIVEIFIDKSKLRVYYSQVNDYENATYHMLYECLID